MNNTWWNPITTGSVFIRENYKAYNRKDILFYERMVIIMNGVEELIFSVVEFAGGIGITTVMTNAVGKATPEGLKTAEKVCVGIGSGMASIAANEIISRECRSFYKGVKKDIKRMKKKFKKSKCKQSYHKHEDKKEDK